MARCFASAAWAGARGFAKCLRQQGHRHRGHRSTEHISQCLSKHDLESKDIHRRTPTAGTPLQQPSTRQQLCQLLVFKTAHANTNLAREQTCHWRRRRRRRRWTPKRRGLCTRQQKRWRRRCMAHRLSLDGLVSNLACSRGFFYCFWCHQHRWRL